MILCECQWDTSSLIKLVSSSDQESWYELTNKVLKKWGRQWVGIFAGAVVGWVLTIIFPVLEQRFSLLSVVMWSAVIGGVLTSLDCFMRAGAALTRRDNRALNLAIGLGIPILIIAVIFLLFR